MIPRADCPGLGGEVSMSTKVPIYMKLGSRKDKKKLWDLLRLDRSAWWGLTGLCACMSKGTQAPELMPEGNQHMAKRT